VPTDEDIASAKTAIGTQPSQPTAPVSGPPDTPASVIADRYEVLALLGVGGMGRVYRVHDRSLDEVVALKLLRRDLLDLGGVLDRFRQEVKLARRVTHPNVVRTFDLGVHAADHFLTMEYIEGRSLAQHLDDGLLPLDELFRIARAACAGIAAAHAAGVLHRDLKPDNILVAKSGRVAITDFGIAQATGDSRDSHAGTPAYMAPEQVEGRAEIGPPADVYAFGAILFEMVTGARPFTGKDLAAVMMARLTKPPPDPRSYCTMPDDLAELVLRCLAIEPARRLADGAALATALGELDTARMAARAAPVPQSVPAKSSRSVALVPLRATGDLTEIADGLSEEIVDALTNTRALRVRPLGSVRQAARGVDDAQAIGRALGVDVVVDGSVRRRGDQVRIGARAIGVVDGFQLWASHVDTNAAGLLAAGDEVARAIARALTVELDPMPARRADSPRATALYLESKAKLRMGWDYGDVSDAISGLEEARALVPDDASILAMLAMAYARAAFYGSDDLATAQRLAERAIALSPTSGETYLALGIAHMYGSRIAEAAPMLAQAVRHSPGLAHAQALLGAVLLEANALDDALLHLEGAHALDRHGPQLADLVRAHIYAGRPDPEVEALADDVSPTHLGARMLRARFLMWRGQSLERITTYDDVPEAQRRYFEIVEELQRTRTISPEDLAMLELNTRVPNPRLRATRGQFLVEFMVHVGNIPKAMEYVQVSVDAGLQDYCWLKRCPMLAPLRGLAGYAELEAVVAGRAKAVIDGLHATLGATVQAPA